MISLIFLTVKLSEKCYIILYFACINEFNFPKNTLYLLNISQYFLVLYMIKTFIHFSEAKSCADGLFQEVLGRKDKADATRNALSVLQRFKFLFYLPLNIERNIQKVDFLELNHCELGPCQLILESISKMSRGM